MNVEKILESKETFVKYLKKKGLEQEFEYFDDEYPDAMYFKVDNRKLLVVYEVFDEENQKKVKDHFLIDRGLSYCVIIYKRKIMFFRNYGEIKYFIYSERTKSNRSKIDKLENIDSSIDILFHSKDVSGHFYEIFKQKRNILVQHISNNISPIKKFLLAQKIFDRLFFIYFLCHKGIIKLNNKRTLSGKTLFGEILLKNGHFFVNLQKMFRLFNSIDKNSLKLGNYIISIPYLNGGLFRPDAIEQELEVTLTNSQWASIIDFLNSYHWIIEDINVFEELEEKILTPEILGHVYERSVVEWEIKGFEKEVSGSIQKTSERKRKGVYYTPEYITEFITRNTIESFLINKFKGKYLSFENLIKDKNIEDLKKALDYLHKIKILDPACGSGAFLIKASETIFKLKRRLYYEIGEKVNYYELKLNIITENIYGVDILIGAIEIAKLRLWLWLISDYEETKNVINALPNIEYNLKVGNSLIGWLNENLTQMPINTPLTEKIDGIFTGLIAFSENATVHELKTAKELLKNYNLNNYIKAYYILYKIYRRTHGLKAENLRNILETIRESIYSAITPSFLDYLNHRINSKYNKKNPPVNKNNLTIKQIFHWKIDFGYIIQNGGFDIVIGNPPYIRQEKIKDIKPILQALYEVFESTSDIYTYFFERSYYLLSKEGIFGFISSNKYFRAAYGKKLRNFLIKKTKIEKIVDFEGHKVFSDATVDTSILIFKKDRVDKNKITIYGPELSVKLLISQEDLSEESFIFLSEKELAIKSKIEQIGIPLKKWNLKIYYGIKTGFNNAFIINNNQREKILNSCRTKEEKELTKNLIKPILRGKDIKKFYFEWKGLWMIIIPAGWTNKQRKESQAEEYIRKNLYSIYSHLKKIGDLKKGKGRGLYCRDDKGDYWWELRPCDYYHAFEQDKIMYSEIVKEPQFYYDTQKYYGEATSFIMTGQNLKYILALLNSKFTSWAFKKYYMGTELGKKGYRYKKAFIEKLPVPKISEEEQKQFIHIVDTIQSITLSEDYFNNKEKKERVIMLQKKLDNLVYKIYKLTDNEIELIENS